MAEPSVNWTGYSASNLAGSARCPEEEGLS
jgi:hypothetical protein